MFHQVITRHAGVAVGCRLPPCMPTVFDGHLAMVRTVGDDEALASGALAVLVPRSDSESPPATRGALSAGNEVFSRTAINGTTAWPLP